MISTVPERKSNYLAGCCHHWHKTYQLDNGTLHGKLSLRGCGVLVRRLRSGVRPACTLRMIPIHNTYADDRPTQSHHQFVQVFQNMKTLDLKSKEAVHSPPIPTVGRRPPAYLDGWMRWHAS